MYDHFTDRARTVMRLANQEAEKRGEQYIGPEHIFLGLLDSRSGLAAHLVQTFDGGVERLRAEIAKWKMPEPSELQTVPKTPRCKKLIERSLEEARNLNHKHVGTQHVLLAMLHEPIEPVTSAFAALGLDAKLLREQILLAISSHANGDDAPPTL
jgi:ATP-dependent Clp protease ATP-binding subunit ClpC